MKDKIKALLRKAGYIKSNGKANYKEVQFDVFLITIVIVAISLVVAFVN